VPDVIVVTFSAAPTFDVAPTNPGPSVIEKLSEYLRITIPEPPRPPAPLTPPPPPEPVFIVPTFETKPPDTPPVAPPPIPFVLEVE
jgi:hypothetical protein